MIGPANHPPGRGAAGLVSSLPGPGGLLPWQGALLAGVCGVFALVHAVAATCSLVVLWGGWGLLGGRARTGLAMLLAFGLGLGLAWLHLPAVPTLPEVVGSGEPVHVRGIVDEVTPRPDRRLTVLLREVVCTLEGGSEVALPGRVSWSWHAPAERILPGRGIELVTRVEPITGFGNPGAWDYPLSQRIKNIHARIYSRGWRNDLSLGEDNSAASHRWRATISKAIWQASPTQGGAMLAAMLTGDRFRLSPETLERVRAAGLAHTLALSGLHLGFVVLLGAGLAWGGSLAWPGLLLRMPRPQLAVLLAAPLAGGYLWLGGFAPSLLRASLMFAFMAFFLLRGRGRAVLDGLFFALAVILLLDPLAALDIRLQLSAVAVAGIGLLLPMVYRWLHRLPGMGNRIVAGGAAILMVSLCASLAVLPLTARSFGMFAPNLLLNLIWLPLLGFVVMPLGFVGLAASPVSAALSLLCFRGGAWVLDAMLLGLDGLHQAGLLPLIQLLRPLWPELLGAALLLACLVASRRLPYSREASLWAAVVLGLALLAGPHVAVMAEDASGLSLSVVDVGQGQALVITTPGGGRTVVDGGGLRSRTFDAGRNIVAPYLTLGRPPRLDHVVLTHPHADHYKGLLHLLNHFKVKDVTHGGSLPGGSYRIPFRVAVGERPLIRGKAGDVLELGKGLRLVTLAPSSGYEPPSTNDASLIQRLEWDGQGLALLCGDAENPSLEHLLASGAELRAQVLVLPHHGSKTSWLPSFYERVNPEIALCSSGFRNRNLQPYAPIVEWLEGHGCAVHCTWASGLLEVRWSMQKDEKRGISAFRTGK